MAKIVGLNVSQTVSRLVGAYNAVLPKVAEQILNDANHYVRMQDGTLADSAAVEGGGRQVTWNTPYAKRVYYTGTPRTNRNPNASLQWAVKARDAHAGEWAAMATKLMKG